MPATPKPPRPDRDRVELIRDRLRAHYGRPRSIPHHDPVGELLLTLLSQNTNDRNRDVAYLRLTERWPSWPEARAASVEQIEAAIAPGGISKIKSKRIKEILDRLATDELPAGADPDRVWRRRGEIDLDWMETTSLAVSREYLCTLPGVARKTAACVLMFAYGLPDIPVDTHVGRVGQRLGLFSERQGFEAMHDAIIEFTPSELALEGHVNLLRHGRQICDRQRPRCDACPLADLCPSRRPTGASA